MSSYSEGQVLDSSDSPITVIRGNASLMTNRRVTMSQIARAAGVSRVTVSNILNGRTRGVWRSSAEQVERVKQIARDLGYRPHGAAKATATGRFGSVALLTRWDIGSSHLNVSKGLATALAARDVHTNYGIIVEQALHEPDYAPRMMRELCVDGLVADLNTHIEPAIVEIVHATRVPTVWVNVGGDYNCVRPDDAAAGRMAADVLLRAGHRHIAYVTDGDRQPVQHFSTQHRITQFEKTVAEAGGTVSRVQAPSLPYVPVGADRWRSLLSSHREPTAWICRGAEIGALMMAAFALGLSVPRDLSILSIDAGETRIGVQSSLLAVPTLEMGQRAAEMILQKIDEPDKRVASVLVPFRPPAMWTIAPPSQR